MSELRWILLAAGLALLAGIYLWGVRAGRRSAAGERERPLRFEPPPPPVAPEPPRIEPQVTLGDEAAPAERSIPTVEPLDAPAATRGAAPVRREPTLGEDIEPPPFEEPGPAAPPPEPRSQKIVAVRVAARLPERFEGGELQEAAVAEGLEFGRYGIFHRLDAAGRPVFSMASLVEPGTFDPRTMPGSAYPGVALFAVLPGPLPARQAFEELITTARSLAERLGGHLQDDRGASLSTQRISHMHEEMIEFDRARRSQPRP